MIPTKLKIKNSLWRIKLTSDKQELNTKLYRGICHFDTKQIFIDESLIRNEIEETLLHELLHACWPDGMCGGKLEEKIIGELSPVLYTILSRNKLFKMKSRKKRSSAKKTYKKHY